MTQDEKTTEQQEPIKVSFSVPQIAGGALAAATAALIGSQLGVAGTIIGAAVASVVGGVAGTLYSAGIDRTHRKVAEAIHRGYDKVNPSGADDVDATQDLAAGGGETRELPAIGDTGVLPGLEDSAIFRPADDTLELPPVGDPGKRKQRLWKVAAITAGAMFVLALVVITVVELGIGRSLDGQNGTTVSQVVRPVPSASRTPTPTPTPTHTPSASTPVPTPTVTTEPSPTVTGTGAPTSAVTPTAATPRTTTGSPATTAPTTGQAAPVVPAPTASQG